MPQPQPVLLASLAALALGAGRAAAPSLPPTVRAGTLSTPAGPRTLLVLQWPGTDADLALRVDGPPGFPDGLTPKLLNRGPSVATYALDAAPVTGRYKVTALQRGQAWTRAVRLDATQVLQPPAPARVQLGAEQAWVDAQLDPRARLAWLSWTSPERQGNYRRTQMPLGVFLARFPDPQVPDTLRTGTYQVQLTAYSADVTGSLEGVGQVDAARLEVGPQAVVREHQRARGHPPQP